MKPTSSFAMIFATTYLVCFCIFLNFEELRTWGLGMFFLSPIVIGWMVYAVLKYGNYTGRQLRPDEEMGYEDRQVH